MRPLEGIVVVSLEQAVAAPFATRQLADLGARVIKIERPGVGDFARSYDSAVQGDSSYFVWLNRDKESLTLDIKDEAAAPVLLRLLERADVWVQNLSPGAAERAGLGSETLRERFPSLITCDISGYGAGGPYDGRRAYDLLIQCETGLVQLNGSLDSPIKTGISVADIAAGMYGFAGILSAVIERYRTGRGRAVEISLLESLGEWVSAPLLMAAESGQVPNGNGLAHPTISPYGPYRTLDGVVVLAVQNEREFARLAEDVLGRPELCDDPGFASNSGRVGRRAELDAFITAFTERYPTDEVCRQLNSADIANSRVSAITDLAHNPQLEARDRWRQVSVSGGTVRCLLSPLADGDGDAPMGKVPGLGEDTDQLLREFGLTPDEIEAMRERHAI